MFSSFQVNQKDEMEATKPEGNLQIPQDRVRKSIESISTLLVCRPGIRMTLQIARKPLKVPKQTSGTIPEPHTPGQHNTFHKCVQENSSTGTKVGPILQSFSPVLM